MKSRFTCPFRSVRAMALACSLALSAAAAFAQQQPIRVFSHRGGRMEHDENTIQAFQASADAGYRGFETDIRMTADGHLVVTHDSSLERTTDGSGTVEEKTLAEIQALRTRQGNRMLTLDELMRFLHGRDSLYVEFEMKTLPAQLYPPERLAEYCEKLYKDVSSAQPGKGSLFLFTSADWRALRYMQEHHPDAQLLLITSKPCCQETIDLCRTLGITRLGATMDGTSRQAVRQAHEAGITVSLWPGNSVDDFLLGAYLGCDYMCTDVPLAVKAFQEKHAPWLNVTY